MRRNPLDFLFAAGALPCRTVPSSGCERSQGLVPAQTTSAPMQVVVGAERAVKVSGGGLAALAARLHFPFLQEGVFSLLVTLHL